MNRIDFAFYEDQKGARIGKSTNVIAKLDVSDLTFIKRTSAQCLTENKYKHPVIIEGEASTSSHDAVTSEIESVGESEVSSSSTTSLFEMPSTSNKEQLSEQIRKALKEVAMVCERYGISDRAGGWCCCSYCSLKGFWNCD